MGLSFDTQDAVEFSCDADAVLEPYRRAAIAEAMGHPAVSPGQESADRKREK